MQDKGAAGRSLFDLIREDAELESSLTRLATIIEPPSRSPEVLLGISIVLPALVTIVKPFIEARAKIYEEDKRKEHESKAVSDLLVGLDEYLTAFQARSPADAEVINYLLQLEKEKRELLKRLLELVAKSLE